MRHKEKLWIYIFYSLKFNITWFFLDNMMIWVLYIFLEASLSCTPSEYEKWYHKISIYYFINENDENSMILKTIFPIFQLNEYFNWLQ